MLLGHDTEYFIFSKKDNRVVPAHTRNFPKEKTQDDWYDGQYFRDGYAVEINNPPSNCRASLWELQSETLIKLQEKKLHKTDTFIADPWAKINIKEDILKGPDDVKQLGCNPTYNPYLKRINEINVDPLKLPFRTTGAHLHMSFNAGDPCPSLDDLGNLALAADLLIGLPFSIIYHDDKEFLRRKLYGRAGEFRPQKYSGGVNGFEYRVLTPRLYTHQGTFGLFVGIWKGVLQVHRKYFMSNPISDKIKPKLEQAINKGKGGEELLEDFSKFLTHNKSAFRVDGWGGTIGYQPKDWGSAILKLREMFDKGHFDKLRILTDSQAHWGWYECNTGKSNSTTIGNRPVEKEEPWNL
jgi:hypothetical protein